jgi:hypothetical protein
VYTPEQIKAAGLDDFRIFLIQVWAHLGLPRPTPVQLDIAYQLQHGPRRLIIQAFRGVGKSWITVAFVLWNLLLNPDIKVMVVSATQGYADDFSGFCKQLIASMPLLQHLQPRPGQRDSAIKFDVGEAQISKDPSVKSVSITGQLAGSRADIIIGDDIEIPKNSFTHLLRQKLREQVKEFDAVLKPGGRVIYLGTPQVEDSLYSLLARERGYATLIWPVRIPEKLGAYAGRLGEFIQRLVDGGLKALSPVDPLRFPEEEIFERRLSYGAAGFALQFMLDTTLSDAEKTPLKCRDFMVLDVDAEQGWVKLVWGRDKDSSINDLACGGKDSDGWFRPVWMSPEMAKWQGTVMAIDPSGRGKDETAIAIVRYLYGYLYLVCVKGYLDGFGEETMKDIARLACEYRVNDIIVEKNYGGGMFDQLLKPWVIATAQNWPNPATGQKGVPAARFDDEWSGWSKAQKEMRICDVLEPILGNHKLVVDRQVLLDDLKVQEETPQYSFIQQLTRMERLKGALPHEDRLEAVSMACGYWVERMDRDREKVHKQHQDKLLDAELRKFTRGIFGDRAPGRQRGIVSFGLTKR